MRRVVWQGQGRKRWEPNTLFYRDGRRLSFLRLRWGRDAVGLLADDGLRQVPFTEIAELHLPRRNPWTYYYDELAQLDPACSGRLIVVETNGGLRATISPAWLGRALAEDDRWLVVQFRVMVKDVPRGAIEVRIAGRPIARAQARVGGTGRFAVALDHYHGPKGRLEVVCLAGDEKGRIDWKVLEIGPRPARAASPPTGVVSPHDAKANLLDDGPIDELPLLSGEGKTP